MAIRHRRRRCHFHDFSWCFSRQHCELAGQGPKLFENFGRRTRADENPDDHALATVGDEDFDSGRSDRLEDLRHAHREVVGESTPARGKSTCFGDRQPFRQGPLTHGCHPAQSACMPLRRARKRSLRSTSTRKPGGAGRPCFPGHGPSRRPTWRAPAAAGVVMNRASGPLLTSACRTRQAAPRKRRRGKCRRSGNVKSRGQWRIGKLLPPDPWLHEQSSLAKLPATAKIVRLERGLCRA